MVIRCGYSSFRTFPVTWIINGTSFNQSAIVDSPLYQLNNLGSPRTLSLTVFSINHTTTFQCLVQSTNSRSGTVIVTTGMYMYVYSCVYVCVCVRVCVHT